MSEPTPPNTPWRPPAEVADGPLVGAVVRLLMAAPRGLWPLLAVMLIVDLAMELAARQAGLSLDGKTFGPGEWAYLVALALVNATLVGTMLHLLLTGRRPAGPRRGVIGYVLWTAAIAISTNSLAFFMVDTQALPPAQVLPRFLVIAVAVIGGTIVVTRLMLLPIAWLVADPGATAARSWGRMHGQVLSYIGASLMLSLPVVLVGILLVSASGSQPGQLSVAGQMISQVMGVALAAISTALSAVVYLRRVGVPEGVGEGVD